MQDSCTPPAVKLNDSSGDIITAATDGADTVQVTPAFVQVPQLEWQALVESLPLNGSSYKL